MQKRKAFTLIELLIVIAIIAILAVIIVMNLLSARDKANYAKAKSEVQTISQAMMATIADGSSVLPTTATVSAATYIAANASLAKNLTVPTPPSGWNNYMITVTNNSGAYSYMASIVTPKASTCSYTNGNFSSTRTTDCQP